MKVKKLEKDFERQNFESTQILEKNQESNKEIHSLKNQNLTFREKLTEVESENNQIKVKKKKKIFFFCFVFQNKFSLD